jgi:hypothetical protein
LELNLLALAIVIILYLLFHNAKLRAHRESLEQELYIRDKLHEETLKELEQAKNVKPTPTTDARQLLHDLTMGEAIVRIIPIDPSEIFIRSPR